MHVRCKTIETLILNVNGDSLLDPLIIGTFEKRAPGPNYWWIRASRQRKLKIKSLKKFNLNLILTWNIYIGETGRHMHDQI